MNNAIKKINNIKNHTSKKIMQMNYSIKVSLINKKIHFFQKCNQNKKKILLYTDSRGFEISNKFYKIDPFCFYPSYFIKNYNVDLYLCPEKHTTLMDFIKIYEQSEKNYDFIIAHVGIVDFSPRHQSVALKEIYPLKRDWYNKIFGEKNMLTHLESNFDDMYEGENTINMFSLEMAEQYLLPYLITIPNLIWIGCNKVIPEWRGNYFRDRPKNIHIIEKYSELFCKKLENPIDLSNWDHNDIKKFTYDNIHLTKSGGFVLLKKIKAKMIEISEEQ